MNELTILIPNETLIKDIERARAIEQSELSALDRLSQATGDYFEGSDVSVKSIASHWAKFIVQPDIAFSHPQQLAQACQQFTEYLETKKPYNQNGTKDIQEPVSRYVSDKLLQIAFKGGWLASEKVKGGVNNILTLRDIIGKHSQLNGIAHKRFIEQLRIGEIDIAALPQQVVIDAFSEVGAILIEKLTMAAKLTLEVKNEAA
jgi:hypothetical protein